MSDFEQMQRGLQLLIDGRSDEDIERLTGISLTQIIGLRGAAAAAPRVFGMFTSGPATMTGPYFTDRLAL